MAALRPKTWLKLIAAPLLLGAVVWAVHPERLAATFRHLNLFWVGLGFFASLVSNLFSALRWQRLALWLGLKAPLPPMIQAYFQGIAANTLLPGGTMSGDLLRAARLVKLGNPLLEGGLSVALDRFSGLWILCSFSGLVGGLMLLDGWPAFWRGPQLPAGPTAALVLVATLALLLAPALLYLGGRHGLLPLLPERWRQEGGRLLARPGFGPLFANQLWLSGLVQVFSITALACGGLAAGLHYPLWVFAVAAAPIFVMAALPVSFGGWGTRETAAAICFAAVGAPTEGAVAMSVLYGLYAAVQALLGLWGRSPAPARP